MTTMTVSQLEYANIFSVENRQKVLEKIINETDNASFVSMFEDESVILFDHEDGKFYASDYRFDEETLQVTLKGFEEVEIIKEKDVLREAVFSFFDEDQDDVSQLSEAYSTHYKQDYYVSELISKSMSKKDFSNIIDYSSIVESEEINLEKLMEEDWFVDYMNRNEEKPLCEMKHINWGKDSITISLLETEKIKKVTENKFERAQDLWKVDKFKRAIVEASKAMIEDVEAGVQELSEAFMMFPEFSLLDSSEKKEIFAKTILFEGSLKADAKQIVEGFTAKLKEGAFDEILSESAEVLAEAGETGDGEISDKPISLNPDRVRKLSESLSILLNKSDNERLEKKINDLIERLDESAEQSYTDVYAVKEAIALLTL